MTDADRYFAMDPTIGEGATGGAYVEVDKDVARWSSSPAWCSARWWAPS
jgi:hypothetical protein